MADVREIVLQCLSLPALMTVSHSVGPSLFRDVISTIAMYLKCHCAMILLLGELEIWINLHAVLHCHILHGCVQYACY